MTAKQVTQVIRGILQDHDLDYGPDFKVQTKRSGDSWVTTVFGVDAEKARAALSEYAKDTPGVTFEKRVGDGLLSIKQPEEQQ